MRTISAKMALPVLLVIASSVAVACGEDNPTPNDDTTDIDGAGGPNDGVGGSSGGGSNDGSGATSSDGSGGGSGGNNEGGNAGETGAGGGSGGEPPIIVEPIDLPDCPDDADSEFESGPIEGEACWSGVGVDCKGIDTPQFLQQCSDNCIAPFDNEARIEGYDGNLPPL